MPENWAVAVAADHYLDMLIRRWRKVKTEIKDLEEQERKLQELILEQPEMRSGVKRDGVTVVRPVRFSGKRARDVLNDDDYQAICEQVPRASKAKDVLPDEVYSLLCVALPKKHLVMGADDDSVAG